MLGQAVQKCADPFGFRRSSQNGIHGDAGARHRLRKASRNRHLRRFGHAIVHHFRRNVLRRLAGNENDAAPILFQHGRQIFSREAHAAEYIDLEKPQPLLVGNFQEALGIEDAEIVDEHIGIRGLPQEGIHAGGGTEVSGNAAQVRTGNALADFFDRLRHTGFGAAVDNHPGPFGG